MSQANILLIATQDTKNLEAAFIRSILEREGAKVYHLDASVRAIVGAAEIGPQEIAAAAGKSIEQVRALKHEGKCLEVMITGAVQRALELHQRVGLHGVIGLGGSMGTSLATTVMQAFPYGLPKVMISTMASGFTQPFVGAKDILMFNPVCDISGLNSITREVFANAAIAVVAMGEAYQPVQPEGKPLITITTLGTTDHCCIRVRKSMEAKGYEVMVFHTLGTGGKAMEAIIRERDVAAVLDLSTIEISEQLNGGMCSAGPDRGRAAIEKGVPTIFVPGNLDFLVAGPLAEAKLQFPGRRYHAHNAALTAVRAGAEEFERDAQYFAELVSSARGPVSFYIPLLGFSNHDSPQGYLQDTSLPPVFASCLTSALPSRIPVTAVPQHINDEAFADRLVEQLLAYTVKG